MIVILSSFSHLTSKKEFCFHMLLLTAVIACPKNNLFWDKGRLINLLEQTRFDWIQGCFQNFDRKKQETNKTREESNCDGKNVDYMTA